MRGLAAHRLLPALALYAAGSGLAPRTAEAIPAFARKYTTSCGTCHGVAFPDLNPFGRRFKENGYQYPAGAEESYRERATIEPGTGGERLLLLRELPLSARIRSSVLVPTDPKTAGGNTVDLSMVDALYLLLGGSVYPDVSIFAAATLAPVALHHAEVGFHNVVGRPGWVNLRAGRFLLLDFLRPEHRSVTRLGNPGGAARVGLNPTTLDSTQHGFDLYGRVLGRRLFYEAAVVQGAQGADGASDLDSNKDVFGQIQVTAWERQTLGVFGYRGRTQITDSTTGVVVRFSDPFWIAGGSADLGRGPFTFHGHALYGLHANAYGSGEHADYWGVRAEAAAAAGTRWLLVGRYDQVESHHETALVQQTATIHLTYLLLRNCKLSVESNARLDDIGKSLLSLRLDLAI